MTMNNVLLTLLLCSVYNMHALPTSASLCTRKPADVVFILDSSFSIWINDFYKERDFVNEVVDKFNIGPNADQTRVGVLTFGHEVRHQFNLKDHLDLRSLKDAVSKIKHEEGRLTKTGDAINFAVTEMFTPKVGSREDVTRIAIVITDGRSQETLKTNLAALRAHDSGIVIFAIGVGRRIDTEELKSIASDPEDEFMFNVTDFNALSSITQKLAAKTCAGIMIALPAPYTLCTRKPADVVFILDSSFSIWINDFYKERDFVNEVVEEFNIGPNADQTRVGVLTFGHEVRRQFDLNDHLDLRSFKEAVSKIKHGEGRLTKTGDAINFAVTEMFTPKVGSRENVTRIAIVITDGRSQETLKTNLAALGAHDSGIFIFAIGVGRRIETEELKSIASDPDDEFMFNVTDFNALSSITQKLAAKTCAVTNVLTTSTSPDTTTSEYTTTTTKRTTATPLNFIKLNKECEGKPADVFFLIDSSGSISTKDFSKELDFVEKVVEEFDTSQGTTRVGLLIFSSDASLTLELNNKLSKKDLIKKIQDVEHTGGGTNTADALRKVRQHGYAYGIARPAAAQIVVLLTDGLSADEELTKREAKLTHMAGIKVFSIGIGTGVDIVELRDVASDPDEDYVFQVDDFASLDSVINKLAVKTCGVKPIATVDNPSGNPVCEVFTNTDIMFIYDTASLGTYKSRAISQFLAVIVSNFDLTTGFLQVGRVTDNCPSGENFPLSNKVSAADFSNIRFSTYSQLIKKVRKSGFSVDNNGRVNSSKVAVLFVDSKKTGANALQEAKAMTKTVEVFIVTIGKSPKVDKFVGQFRERNIMQVNSYADLASASTQILHKMCFFLENNGDKDSTIDYVIPV